ncbi:hypothetical protein PAESOLCIP111_01047 [Paenibacillus solanacearum]|uniref:Uncharacterized protein n=1 Tax=Paenibacillus solanacearum TaxID=2048548 RepID=A0A916JYQ2_9BACL|nr:hypothetical protein PAESOLCIP111_01047 [Paenibacillus solanacearum]
MDSMERNNEYGERGDVQSSEIHYFTPTAFESWFATATNRITI